MDESKLFEVIGRKQVALELRESGYIKVLNVLHLIASGQLDPTQVEVDLTNQRWRVLDEPHCRETAHPDKEPAKGSYGGSNEQEDGKEEDVEED